MAISTRSGQPLEKEVLDQDESPLSPEWLEELQRRVDDIDSGKSKLIPAADLWDEIDRRFETKL